MNWVDACTDRPQDYQWPLPAIRPATTGNLTELSICSRLVISIEPVAACTSLRKLHVDECRHLTDLRPLSSCTQLRELHIGGCRRLSDLSPLRECTLLEKLALYECPKVVSLAPLRARQLQELDLSQTGVTDLSPLQGLPALRSLNLLLCDVRNVAPLTSLSALTSLGMPFNGATLSDMPLPDAGPSLTPCSLSCLA
jgi:Leucine-rich repeat (LRR) protein